MSLPAVPPSATASPLDSLLMAKSRPAILPATQCSPTQQPSSGAAAQASEASSSHDDSVGPDNIEGYGAVQDLAEFLVGLRHHRLALSGEEANQVITLWQMLGEYDKRKTIYPIRHRTNLEQGRFRATKKIVAPGVESTKRSFIGAHSPAQWPDCNRVVEAVFLRLCALYPNAVHCDGKKVSRFTMMARLYKHIRECVITNSRVMSETTIQLPEVNAATLTQWYSRRSRGREQKILLRGVPAPDPPMAAPEKLCPAVQKDPSLFSASLLPPHQFILPLNTAGEAHLKGRPQPQAIFPTPQPHPQLHFLSQLPPGYVVPSGAASSQVTAAPGRFDLI
ncbi:uncharacterized protein LOC133440742 [Cololabis saira]|uniref:uncharacterized protein LOC133440742 n=1 Tax=Cololabis saira TaxID=129043 RepID=UPI002AD2C4F8|nr:uncharacterized protein LOC133440742 [Cololabis saira]